jgi:TetR/AcrR family tetracycline transcriptional repressor
MRLLALAVISCQCPGVTESPKSQPLDRSNVVQTALRLLNETGLEGLTTRRLADALGVQGPALYWHFKNKQELIDEMALAMLAEASEPHLKAGDWADWLLKRARRLREVMLSYRDGARLFAGYRPSGPHGRVDPDAFLEPLVAAGFSRTDAFSVAIIVFRFTFGWTDDEQNAAERGTEDPVENLPDPDQLFEFGLAMIIEGAKVRFADRLRSAETGKVG